jgi:hypothetical protein
VGCVRPFSVPWKTWTTPEYAQECRTRCAQHDGLGEKIQRPRSLPAGSNPGAPFGWWEVVLLPDGDRDHGGGRPGSRGERPGQHVPDNSLPDEHPDHHPEPAAAAALARRAARIVSGASMFIFRAGVRTVAACSLYSHMAGDWRRWRILASPPRPLPARWRRARHGVTPAQGKRHRRKWRASRRSRSPANRSSPFGLQAGVAIYFKRTPESSYGAGRVADIVRLLWLNS